METDIYEVMGRIESYLDTFDAILRHGHSVYESYPPELVVDHDASAQAHCTYRHILAEAEKVFGDFPEVQHMKIRGQNLWLFKDVDVVCRFKKTDENGVSANYQTAQARDFEEGRELPGLPPAPTRLTVGYLLDEFGVGYARSQVSLPVKMGALWCAAIVPIAKREAEERPWIEVTRQRRLW